MGRPLSDEQVEEIKRLRAAGVPVRDVAAKFGCWRQTITAIVSGRSYNLRWPSGVPSHLRQIPGHPEYYVSESGDVYKQAKRPLKQQKNCMGYMMFDVCTPKRVKLTTHRAVAMAWCPGYEPHLCVNHKDGVPLNNHASNLEWVTPSENARHAITTGLRKRKLTKEQVCELKQKALAGASAKALAVEYGVSREHASRIIRNDSYFDVGAIPAIRRMAPSNAVLTEQMVLEMREMFATGSCTVTAISKKYAVNHGTVWQAVHKVTWKHV